MKTFAAALCLLTTLVLAAPTWGQSAPAGNEHPQTRMLSREGKVNPFGEPKRAHAEVADKWAFSKQVDLAPLRDLTVSHNSRLKILDTLARETIGGIVGRKDYFDIRTELDGSGALAGEMRLRYDPLFSYLDMVIDPSYYDDKLVIAVAYLPLREEYIRVITQDEKEAERLKRMGRLTPRQVGMLSAEVGSVSMQDVYQKAMGKVHESLMLFALGAQNFDMVPAATADQPWLHLGTLAPDSPAAKAVRALGESWRNLDAAGVNSAAKALAEALPAINPQIYPTTRRSLELTYNRSNAFEWGFWLYALSLVFLMLSFGTGRRWLLWAGLATLLVAASLHAFGFTVRCLIAERFAIQNQFESMTGVSLFAAVVGLVLAAIKRQALFAAAVAAVGFLVLVTATQTGIPGYAIEREAAILNTSVLLKYHVTTVLISYGLISLGFIVSLFYLGTHYFAKPAAAGPVFPQASISAVSAAALGLDGTQPKGRARILADLDSAQMTILQMAFWTLGVGILLGAWWADHSWGRWWAFDPKELWALLTWVVYLIVVHLRHGSLKNKALATAWLSVLGFFVMLWCYFGVNLLLPGLHAYA